MNYGFTGTREGMTARQKSALLHVLDPGDRLAHGDCIGADNDAEFIARKLQCATVALPGPIPALRAYTPSTVVHEPRAFMVRNRLIVDESDILIAAPRTLQEEQQGSGTWATIRYARKVGKPVIILDP
jgi:hypothetical protein